MQVIINGVIGWGKPLERMLAQHYHVLQARMLHPSTCRHSSALDMQQQCFISAITRASELT